MSLYGLYFLAGKLKTAGERAQKSDKGPETGGLGFPATPPAAEPQPHNICQSGLRRAWFFRRHNPLVIRYLLHIN